MFLSSAMSSLSQWTRWSTSKRSLSKISFAPRSKKDVWFYHGLCFSKVDKRYLNFFLVNILVNLIKYLWEVQSIFFLNLWIPWEKATSILIHSNFYTIIFWYQTFMAKFLQRHGPKRFKSHWSSAPLWGLSLWSRWTWDMDRHQDLGHRFLLNLL